MSYLPIPKNELNKIATDMRFDILKMVKTCGKQNGHLGGCMSAVELLAVLYTQVMNINDLLHSELQWSLRDRFIMSKGHAGIAMYAAMKQVGLISQEMIDGSIRGEGSVLYRHPKRNIEYGIECSVGSLGMGLGYANGLAESFRRRGTAQKIFVMIGDGECDEGSVWESAAYASHRGLDNIVVIVDMNGLQLDGPTHNVLAMDNMSERWKAFGFKTVEIDGHNFDEIIKAFQTDHGGKPLAIIARTVKGKGISFAENKTEWHDNFLSEELYEKGVSELGNVDLDEIRRKAKERFDSKRTDFAETISDNDIKLDENADIIRHWNSYGSKKIIGETAFLLAENDEKIALIYSDCGNRIGIEKLKERYPDKCYEVGISEQNQVCMAAAMAQEGFHVFAIAYAPFITARVLDQIRANLGYMKAPVCLIGLGAGMASSDLGATHTAFEDVANLRGLPGVSVVTPVDTYEIVKGMEYFVNNPSPLYLRITINSPDCMIYNDIVKYDPYDIDVLKYGEDALMLVSGAIIGEALGAVNDLSEGGYSIKVVNVRSIKPLSLNLIDEMEKYKKIITVEEHSIIGGLGSAVAETIASHGLICQMKCIGIKDEYFSADISNNVRKKAQIDKYSIINSVLSFLSDKEKL